MHKLIEALLLIASRDAQERPTRCDHDVMYVNADVSLFTSEEIARLDDMGFFPSSEGGFMSFWFGNC